ncbi:hypothetical protein VNO77_43532 [Canavalia gladiata]|uniref:Uncharacterized protein n=1 Tax=Canavalia gladiata TaxID=3824 RepID=A0AAN9JWX2_CANGL
MCGVKLKRFIKCYGTGCKADASVGVSVFKIDSYVSNEVFLDADGGNVERIDLEAQVAASVQTSCARPPVTAHDGPAVGGSNVTLAGPSVAGVDVALGGGPYNASLARLAATYGGLGCRAVEQSVGPILDGPTISGPIQALSLKLRAKKP